MRGGGRKKAVPTWPRRGLYDETIERNEQGGLYAGRRRGLRGTGRGPTSVDLLIHAKHGKIIVEWASNGPRPRDRMRTGYDGAAIGTIGPAAHMVNLDQVVGQRDGATRGRKDS